MEYRYTAELYHHGILGQKWGKPNGPPYPLEESKHSMAEKKAGWKKSLGKSNSVDNRPTGSYTGEEKKISVGKALAKRILIGAGAAAVAAAISSLGSGDGADEFDDDAYMKSLMLRYSGSDKKKLYSKDGRRIVANQKFPRVMAVAKSKMPSNAKPGDFYQAYHDGYMYTCEVSDDLTPKIVNYYKPLKRKR